MTGAIRRLALPRLVVALVAAMAALHATADVLVLKNGSRIAGRLKVCDEEHCTVDGTRVPLEQIATILFRPDVTLPTSVARTSLIRVDGSIIPGVFTGLNLGVVTFGGVDHDRETVAAVVLVPFTTTAAEEPPHPKVIGDPPPPPPPPTSTAPRTGSPSPKSPHPDTTCKAGPLWTGTIESHRWGTIGDISGDYKISAQVMLRESLCPIFSERTGRRVGTMSEFISVGTSVNVHSTYTTSDENCSGSGKGLASKAHSFIRMFRRDGDEPLVPGGAVDAPKGPPIYSVSIAAPDEEMVKVICRYDTHLFPAESLPTIGRFPQTPPGDPEQDPQIRRLQGGKMIGSVEVPSVSPYQHVAFSWSICPEGIACPEAPPVPDQPARP